MLRTLLVEDHQLMREGLRLLLENHGRTTVVGQADDGSQVMELVAELRPDLVIMDISMPNLNGIEAAARLREMAYPPLVIMLSQHKRPEYVVQAIRAGAMAYLLKDAVIDELDAAIDAVLDGRRYLSASLPEEMIDILLYDAEAVPSLIETLTPREREVLQLVAEGNTNRQVAAHLSISVKTVEKHRFNMMEKLNIRDVTGLVRFAMQNGIIDQVE